MPEQFGLQKRFGERPAIDGDEGIRAARAIIVYGTRDELFSRTTLASHQNITRRHRGFRYRLVDANDLGDLPIKALCKVGGTAGAGDRSEIGFPRASVALRRKRDAFNSSGRNGLLM